MNHKLYSFAFRGLLTSVSLGKTGYGNKEKFSERSELEMAKRLGIPFMDEDLIVRARKMSLVYVAICTFENEVRDFISKKLLEEKGEKWWDTSVNSAVRKRAEDRMNKEKDLRWLTPRGNSPLYYTEFGDLISIIGNEKNWKFFQVHVVEIDWAKQIITTLEKSRNIIMHSGELSPSDIERVGMYIRDWMQQVG